MSRRAFATLALLMLLSGCAHAPAMRTQLAGGGATMCKHCNCFMPADVDPNKICPVCHCGFPAHACRRGK